MQAFTIELPISTVKRLEKLGSEELFNFLLKKVLTGVNNLCYYCRIERRISMPNKHKCDLRMVTYWLPIELMTRLKKIADLAGIPLAKLVRRILEEAVEDVSLSSEDQAEVLAEIKRNEEKRNKSV